MNDFTFMITKIYLLLLLFIYYFFGLKISVQRYGGYLSCKGLKGATFGRFAATLYLKSPLVQIEGEKDNLIH